MIEHVRYGDGTVRPVDETTRASHAPCVILRDPLSGETLTVDARLTCIPSEDRHRGSPTLGDEEVDRRDLVEISEVARGAAVYIDDPLGGTWRRFHVVSAAHGCL